MARPRGVRARREELSGGYWIAEASPTVGDECRYATWNIRDVRAVLALTDGVADGVDIYGTPPNWSAAFAIAAIRLPDLVRRVHDIEESDPECARWPRAKLHDDKAVVRLAVQF